MRIKRLNALTEEEKAVLKYYIDHNTRTQVLDFSNGTVQELAGYAIIYRAATISKGGVFFSYNIQPWAMDYLLEHPNLVQTNYPEFAHSTWSR